MKLLMMIAMVVAAMAGMAAEKKIAVFVQNRTQAAIDVGAVRERFIAGLAEVAGITVVDSTMATDAFNASPNVAKQLGVDYVAVVGIVGASSVKRSVNGRESTVFSLRMTTKITDSNAASVSGFPTWTRQLPILDASGDPMAFYDMLLDQWQQEAVASVAQSAQSWRVPTAALADVPFLISTTADRPIAEYESQTKGLGGERLAELRKVAGGATVEIDGIAVGTAPCAILTSPGLHKLRVTREWMQPYESTVSVVSNGSIEVALELSAEGVAKWGSIEKVQAETAERYAKAVLERKTDIKIDTSKWRDAALGAGLHTLKVTD